MLVNKNVYFNIDREHNITKMMPLAPTSLMALPTTKPKIGFSIDSIVGNASALTKTLNHVYSSGSECSERPTSPFSDCGVSGNYSTELNVQIRNQTSLAVLYHRGEAESRIHLSPTRHLEMRNNRKRRYSNSSSSDQTKKLNFHANEYLQTPSPQENDLAAVADRLSADEEELLISSRNSSPTNNATKSTVSLPLPTTAGIVRPFAVTGTADTAKLPPYLSSPEMIQHTNPHFLAAQFQMAAALAHGQAAAAAQSGQYGGLPSGNVFAPHQLPPHYVHNPNMPRDAGYPLYPWLLSRHGRIFPNRFPGSKLTKFLKD